MNDILLLSAIRPQCRRLWRSRHSEFTKAAQHQNQQDATLSQGPPRDAPNIWVPRK